MPEKTQIRPIATNRRGMVEPLLIFGHSTKDSIPQNLLPDQNYRSTNINAVGFATDDVGTKHNVFEICYQKT